MERPYYVDEKGDKNNVQFGHLYRLDIPSYRRSRFVCLIIYLYYFIENECVKKRHKVGASCVNMINDYVAGLGTSSRCDYTFQQGEYILYTH
jgi:hypothetical protein